mmetsp:Transcript_22666/g.34647  ORF Transcript_22666/g.34647 Transcript_22666/m.34647 type:complete len:208 (-) Transcript_22666:1360-1983(-)
MLVRSYGPPPPCKRRLALLLRLVEPPYEAYVLSTPDTTDSLVIMRSRRPRDGKILISVSRRARGWQNHPRGSNPAADRLRSSILCNTESIVISSSAADVLKNRPWKLPLSDESISITDPICTSDRDEISPSSTFFGDLLVPKVFMSSGNTPSVSGIISGMYLGLENDVRPAKSPVLFSVSTCGFDERWAPPLPSRPPSSLELLRLDS